MCVIFLSVASPNAGHWSFSKTANCNADGMTMPTFSLKLPVQNIDKSTDGGAKKAVWQLPLWAIQARCVMRCAAADSPVGKSGPGMCCMS